MKKLIGAVALTTVLAPAAMAIEPPEIFGWLWENRDDLVLTVE